MNCRKTIISSIKKLLDQSFNLKMVLLLINHFFSKQEKRSLI